MKKKLLVLVAIILAIVLTYFLLSPKTTDAVYLTASVKKGEFKSEVITSGEAQSTNSKKINGPSNARRFGIYNIKIQDLVAEGTVVKKGGYIGKLDQSELNEKILDARLNLDKAQSRYTQVELDTTLSLKQERNQIKDLIFKISEAKLELKQSIYEPPATVKKLEIGIEKNDRDLKEKKEDYSIKKRQANAKMIEVGTEVSKIKKKINDLLELQKNFTITSTDNGMVTYIKDWNGNKKKVGSTISPWEPAIASLPDLTKMESKTYANEVDIRKIKKGLAVTVSFDAFPDIEMEGKVTKVANVGEKKRGSDINVFQVTISINGSNENIRPGMTTSNRILTYKKEDILSIPLEAIFSKDSITYVYKKNGFSILKKQIEIGNSNNNEIVISKGLTEGDVVYLNKPDGYENASIEKLN